MPQDIPLKSAEPSTQPGLETSRSPADERLLRLPSTLKRVEVGRSMWLDMVKTGKAPAPIRLGRATLWLESELNAWIAQRVRESRGGR